MADVGSGPHKIIDLPDIFQSLANKRWTGTLQVIGRGKNAYLFFKEGIVQHTKADVSKLILGRALDFCLESRLSDAMTKAQAMQRGGVGWYPQSGFIHIDTGPIRNWTLDERGLDNLLLFDSPQLRLDGTSRALGGGSWRPLTMTQQLTFQHRLVQAEFLARTRGFRFNP